MPHYSPTLRIGRQKHRTTLRGAQPLLALATIFQRSEKGNCSYDRDIKAIKWAGVAKLAKDWPVRGNCRPDLFLHAVGRDRRRRFIYHAESHRVATGDGHWPGGKRRAESAQFVSDPAKHARGDRRHRRAAHRPASADSDRSEADPPAADRRGRAELARDSLSVFQSELGNQSWFDRRDSAGQGRTRFRMDADDVVQRRRARRRNNGVAREQQRESVPAYLARRFLDGSIVRFPGVSIICLSLAAQAACGSARTHSCSPKDSNGAWNRTGSRG